MLAAMLAQMESIVTSRLPLELLVANGMNGIKISSWTFAITLLLDLWCFDTVKKVLKQPGAGMQLYISAVMANVRNHFIFGWPIYAVAATLFCPQEDEFHENHDGIDIWIGRVGCVSTILLVHSLLFYTAHRAFHTYPELYCHHRFHHRFNVNVTPMAANAVSVVEYVVAYILPFTVAMPFLRPDLLSLQLSVSIVAITNLLVHTPKLCEMYSKFCPAWLVSAEDHLEHHRKLNTKYAAPTINIDYFVSTVDYDKK